MTTQPPTAAEPTVPNQDTDAARVLSPEAKRALAEAAERRQLQEQQAAAGANENGGRGGLDPVRYGDWEKGGLAWDF